MKTFFIKHFILKSPIQRILSAQAELKRVSEVTSAVIQEAVVEEIDVIRLNAYEAISRLEDLINSGATPMSVTVGLNSAKTALLDGARQIKTPGELAAAAEL